MLALLQRFFLDNNNQATMSRLPPRPTKAFDEKDWVTGDDPMSFEDVIARFACVFLVVALAAALHGRWVTPRQLVAFLLCFVLPVFLSWALGA